MGLKLLILYYLLQQQNSNGSKLFMVTELSQLKMPSWLASLKTNNLMTAIFPLKEIIHDSLFYPACGFDGQPVKYFAGNVYSFIYVDYSRTKKALFQELESSGFRGYNIAGYREISKRELALSDWEQIMPIDFADEQKHHIVKIAKPYAIWAIFQRENDFSEEHGPKRFSLLYLCAEGVAAYQALFNSNNIVPKIIAIINPGTGFGGNWTNFEDPDKIFAKIVKQNKAGIPRYLIYGGRGNSKYYKESCWPDIYGNCIYFIERNGGGIGVWQKSK